MRIVNSSAPSLSRRRLLTTAAMSALAAPAVLRGARAQSDTIRIGFPVPLTGPYGAEAQDQARAAELAIAEFNKAGGLDGRMAELLVRDDKLKPGEAATRTLELIEKDKVHFVVGSLSASVQLAVNEVTKARGIIYDSISQSDSINEAQDFSKYTFHEALNPHMTAGAVARHVFEPGQKVAFLTADYAYGYEMVRGFQVVGEEVGVEVLDDIRHPLGTADYSTFLPRIQAMAPDVLCICNFGRDQLNSIKQAVAFGMKQQMRIAVPVLLYNQRLAGSADDFEGVIGGANYHWTLEETVPSARAFNDAYRQAYDGAVPSDYGAYGYVSVRSLLEATRIAGTTGTDAVIAALEGLRYDYYKGPQYFRGCDHQSVQSVLIVASKKKADMRNEHDVFDILHIETPDEAHLRSCEALGHEA